MKTSIKSKSLLMALILAVGLSAVPMRSAQGPGNRHNHGIVSSIKASIRKLTGKQKELDRQLFQHIRNKNAEAVLKVLEAGANVNVTDPCNRTALMYAARGEHSQIVAILLEHNANVQATTSSGETALTFVASKPQFLDKQGGTAVVQQLLAAKANVNQQNQQGEIALAQACSFGHTGIYRELRHAGAEQISLTNAIELAAICPQALIDIVDQLKPEAVLLHSCLPKHPTPIITLVQEYLHGPLVTQKDKEGAVCVANVQTQLSPILQQAEQRGDEDLAIALRNRGILSPEQEEQAKQARQERRRQREQKMIEDVQHQAATPINPKSDSLVFYAADGSQRQFSVPGLSDRLLKKTLAFLQRHPELVPPYQN